MTERETPAVMGSDETAHDSHVAVLAACWRSQTLGVAFLEDDGTLRWLSVADASPDFRVLQAVKYTTSPGTILAPASSDPDWMDALGASAMGGASGPEPGPDQDGTASVEAEYHVVVTKARDFTADAAYKRLALCHNLVGLPDRELTEKELLVYLEHLIPREQQAALRAIGGLLSHVQRSSECPAQVTAVEPFALESHVFVSPETFVSLNIFEDVHHPSQHGGRGKEGFSVWGLFNRTRSKPGERMLRSWFARPSQEVGELRKRFDFVSFLSKNCSLLPQLQEITAKLKDVTKVEASVARGGLLLADFTALASTAVAVVKAREVLRAGGVPEAYPIVATINASVRPEMVDVANMITGVIDAEASRAGKSMAAGAAPHIHVNDGVDPELDEMRRLYAELEGVLDHYASAEKRRLGGMRALDFHLAEEGAELFVVYVPQMGFMLKLPSPRVLEHEECGHAWEDAGLQYSFENGGEVYFKTQECERLDDEYGDIASAIKDQEAKLIRDLESEMLHELPALKRAQHALAELDCLLALAASARDLGLTRPEITDDGATRIKQGWHPLLRQRVPQLVPNDCELGGSGSPGRLMLLTGPNASGKTVYLRTVALITYLAHVGSFVPAEAAVIARADAIHTRMHSRESAAVNASAFMLDLSQMAAMLRHATPRSLCLIDEFGKGTNAQDGISLLYACLQHFLERGDACPKTLACTHYTELLEVPGFRSSRNLVLWTMEVMLQPKEEADDTLDEVVFLHRARPGEFGDSFGWHCAASADLPPSVIERARAISHARAGGLPVFAIDSDVEGIRRRDEAVVAFVDAFLDYDFGLGSADGFYEQEAQALAALALRAAA